MQIMPVLLFHADNKIACVPIHLEKVPGYCKLQSKVGFKPASPADVLPKGRATPQAHRCVEKKVYYCA